MRSRALFAASASLALAACAAGPAPRVETPPPVLPEAFLFAPDEATAASLAALLPSDDPAFRVLGAKALAGSSRPAPPQTAPGRSRRPTSASAPR